jgi:hypothetical protein
MRPKDISVIGEPFPSWRHTERVSPTNRHIAPFLLESCRPGGVGIADSGRENAASPPSLDRTRLLFRRSVPVPQPRILQTLRLPLH